MTAHDTHPTHTTRREFLRATCGGITLAGAVATDAATQTEPAATRSAENSNGRFAGKVILVTGGTSGIGEAAAIGFAEEGGKVFLCGRRVDEGQRVQAAIERFGGAATFVQADVRSEQQMARFVRRCIDTHGRLDVAYNNAAVLPTRLAKTAEWSHEEFDNVWRTNFLGVWYCMRHELPAMAERGGGVIINCATVGAHRSYPGIMPYTSSKTALVSMTRSAAAEYGKRKVRVLSISPGQVDTPMLLQGARLGEAEQDDVAITPSNAVDRIISPAEIARSILWLASEEASCVTGCDVDVSAGQLIY
jgi:NAD(P)-dependent dehydrogenase (short-subunit alcohol dehydrogenase family)